MPIRLLALLAAIAGGASLVAAQQPGQVKSAAGRQAPTTRATRTTTAPTIDGRLDDPAWAQAPVISGFIQNEPNDGRSVTERTEVRMLFDDQAIYIGAWLFDSDPSAIVAGESRRDVDLTQLDAFLMVVDTYQDRQNAFVFGTSPMGVEYDGQVTREGEGGSGQNVNITATRQQRGAGAGLNVNWDGNWTVAATRDGAGWYAEFRIPFSTLRYPKGGAQSWGLNFSRNIRRKNEQAFWAPVPRQYTLLRVSLAGTVEGLDAPAQRVVSFTPYALGSTRRDFSVPKTTTEADVGGDFKYGVTQSLTLDLTYNTDFAQVEVDDQQVNLTRFSVFFPEKRTFFLENAGTFAVGTPETAELFFSRRIGIGPNGRTVPLLGGARLSGKSGGTTLGFLNIQAQARDDIDPQNYGVVRVMRELPNRSRIGGVVVSRFNTDSTGDRNLTYGLDGRLGLGDRILVDGYAALTDTPGLKGNQYAWSLGASYTDRNWEGGVAVRDLAENFNPEVGFLVRDSYYFLTARVLRHVRTPSISWLRELRPHVTFWEYRDRDWFVENRLVHIDSHVEFANGAFFQLPGINFTTDGLQQPFEIADGVIIPAGTYHNWYWGFAYNTDLSAPLSVQGRLDIGGLYSGSRVAAYGTVNGRWGPMVGSVRYSWNDVKLPEGDFVRKLVGLKLAYSFTPRIYLQGLAQYSNESRSFQGNLRLGWLTAAGTGLYVVYNDAELDGDGTDGEAPGWRPQERALIIKFTKLFDFR
jgi:hypothetical protein